MSERSWPDGAQGGAGRAGIWPQFDGHCHPSLKGTCFSQSSRCPSLRSYTQDHTVPGGKRGSYSSHSTDEETDG